MEQDWLGRGCPLIDSRFLTSNDLPGDFSAIEQIEGGVHFVEHGFGISPELEKANSWKLSSHFWNVATLIPVHRKPMVRLCAALLFFSSLAFAGNPREYRQWVSDFAQAAGEPPSWESQKAESTLIDFTSA